MTEEERKKYQKEYYKKNKEQKKRYQKEYYFKNRDKIKISPKRKELTETQIKLREILEGYLL